MNAYRQIFFMIFLSVLLVLGGCSGKFWGGTAAGAAAAGGAYELQNKRALEELEDDLKAGRIDREEYERRKDEIEDRSILE